MVEFVCQADGEELRVHGGAAFDQKPLDASGGEVMEHVCEIRSFNDGRTDAKVEAADV